MLQYTTMLCTPHCQRACLSKFDIDLLLSEDVQNTVLECLLQYHKAKLLEGFYTMQQKLA